jgi:hypothetical protein
MAGAEAMAVIAASKQAMTNLRMDLPLTLAAVLLQDMVCEA